MLRCTIELVPGGDETRKRVIGCVEIANVGGTQQVGNYSVVLKKTPPFAGALRAAWKRGLLKGEDDDAIAAEVIGHHRQKRGSYDLLYRALRACGLEERNPQADGLTEPEALRAVICGLREAQAGPVSTGRWYCVDITGRAMLCADQADAEAEAAKLDAAYQRFGPHRAVKLYTAPPTSAAADAPAQGVLRNFEITGPDGDGLVWLVLRGHGTSGSAMFNLGAANRLAAQVALKLEEDRRAALAASAQTEVGR